MRERAAVAGSAPPASPDVAVPPRHVVAPTLRQSDLFSKEHNAAAYSLNRSSTTHPTPHRTPFSPLPQVPKVLLPYSGVGTGAGGDEAGAALSAAFSAAVSALDLSAVARVAARHGVRPESAALGGVLWRQCELLFFAFCAFAHPPPAIAAPAAAALAPPVTAPWWRMDAPRFGALCALCELGGAVVAEDAPAAIFARAQAHYSTAAPRHHGTGLYVRPGRFGALYYGEGAEGGDAAARTSGAAEGGGELHVFLHALLDLAAATAVPAGALPKRTQRGGGGRGDGATAGGASADLPELFEHMAARVAHRLSASPQPGGKPRPLVLAAGVRAAMGSAPIRMCLSAAELPLRRAFCLWETSEWALSLERWVGLLGVVQHDREEAARRESGGDIAPPWPGSRFVGSSAHLTAAFVAATLRSETPPAAAAAAAAATGGGPSPPPAGCLNFGQFQEALCRLALYSAGLGRAGHLDARLQGELVMSLVLALPAVLEAVEASEGVLLGPKVSEAERQRIVLERRAARDVLEERRQGRGAAYLRRREEGMERRRGEVAAAYSATEVARVAAAEVAAAQEVAARRRRQQQEVKDQLRREGEEEAAREAARKAEAWWEFLARREAAEQRTIECVVADRVAEYEAAEEAAAQLVEEAVAKMAAEAAEAAVAEVEAEDKAEEELVRQVEEERARKEAEEKAEAEAAALAKEEARKKAAAARTVNEKQAKLDRIMLEDSLRAKLRIFFDELRKEPATDSSPWKRALALQQLTSKVRREQLTPYPTAPHRTTPLLYSGAPASTPSLLAPPRPAPPRPAPPPPRSRVMYGAGVGHRAALPAVGQGRRREGVAQGHARHWDQGGSQHAGQALRLVRPGCQGGGQGGGGAGTSGGGGAGTARGGGEGGGGGGASGGKGRGTRAGKAGSRREGGCGGSAGGGEGGGTRAGTTGCGGEGGGGGGAGCGEGGGT